MTPRSLLRSSGLLAALVAVSPASLVRVASAQQAAPKVDPNEARKQLGEGDAAARAKDWPSALDRYAKSNDAMPNVFALSGLANAQYQLGKVVEAHASYTELLATYDARLQRPQKAEAEARLKELASRTSLVTIDVDEPGATIAIDGRTFGQSPRATPMRLPAGVHLVRVAKDGFVGYEKSTDAPGGGVVTVTVKLARESAKGTLGVREKSGQAARVIVDGNDVGAAPWTGELDPGAHEVALRSASSAAPAQTVQIVKGAKVDVELVAVRSSARLEVRTSDAKGNIYVDGKLVGEGSFVGEVDVGAHEVEVRREGFDSFQKSIVLADRQVYSEAVTLRRPGGGVAGGQGVGDRIFQGVYGGFGLMGVAAIGGMGTELETHCSSLGAARCDTPGPLGGGAFGYVGYTFDPVGFEVMLGGLFDATEQRATFDGTSRAGENPLVATPARNERFKIYRAGGMAALRVRGTAQLGRSLRASLAGGLGLSYRYVVAERKATSADGTNMQDVDVFDGLTYLSPAISAEAALHWRLGATTALSLGLTLWAENAGSGAATPSDPNRHLASATAAVPLATPSYHLASSTQVFLGPYVGMIFGP